MRATPLTVLAALCAFACSSADIHPIPGTTTRVGKPVQEGDVQLDLRIFADENACSGSSIRTEDQHLCLPNVDRASGEVRLAYQYRLDGIEYYMPEFKDHLQISHQGRLVQDGKNGHKVEIIPHEPQPVKQLFILVIDGSASMSDFSRMKFVKKALQLEEVKDAFFPKSVTTGVVLLQFTSGKPVPVGGELKVLGTKAEYTEAVKQLGVLGGYTHLYDAVTYATSELLANELIKSTIENSNMAVTIVALTDGFNNQAATDTCGDNAARLSRLLKHLVSVRTDQEVNLLRRPEVFTVGLGKLAWGGFQLTEVKGTDIAPPVLCGNKPRLVERRIDGDIEDRGIDNASLSLIADRGGGLSYVRREVNGLGEAFRSAAAARYAWFELRYRINPFYLRRKFTTKLELQSYAVANASVDIYPSAWLDAPPGIRDDRLDGWTRPQRYAHTLTVVMPIMGMLIALSYLGGASFNVKRALFGRTRPPKRTAVRRLAAAPPPPPGQGSPPPEG